MHDFQDYFKFVLSASIVNFVHYFGTLQDTRTSREKLKMVNKMVKRVNLKMVNNYIVTTVCIGWSTVIELIDKSEVNVNKGLRSLLFQDHMWSLISKT